MSATSERDVSTAPVQKPTDASQRSSRLGKRAAYLARRLLVPFSLLAIWVVVTRASLVDPIFVPGPGDLWDSFQAIKDQLPSAIGASLTMTLTGFLLGTIYGIATGLLMAYSKIVRELFGGVLDFIRPVPVFALIPLFVLWFGIGKTPQIALIALGTSVILGVTTIEAIRNIAPVHVRAALTLGASRATIYRTVAVPSILPHLLGAIRLAAAASWGLDVAAEFIGAQNGLGYLMIVQQQYLDTAGIVLIVIIYSLLAVLLDLAIRAAERPFTRWTERQTRTGIVAGIVGAS
jgi:ABC-type nitrate/sulfonate/bicarbonate transport system permease component